jgi:DNA-binding transcriptional ArsR family regulator
VPTTASADFIDHEMAKALSHPERVRIMSEFSALGRAGLSASSYARRYDMDVSYVAHHFRSLAKWGLIEEVATKRVRGAVETIYRSKRKLIMVGACWEALPLEFREGMSGRTMNNLMNTVMDAVKAGTFEARPEERALGWDKITLDERGWKKLAVAFRQLMDIAAEASEESEARLAETGDDPILAAWGLLLFEYPDQKRKRT